MARSAIAAIILLFAVSPASAVPITVLQSNTSAEAHDNGFDTDVTAGLHFPLATTLSAAVGASQATTTAGWTAGNDFGFFNYQ
jgi:hypothetical protein